LTQLERRDLELNQVLTVAVARINTLLHLRPNAPLPPPPGQLAGPTHQVDLAAVEQIATQQRPDLTALAARIAAERAALELAIKQRYPDTEVFGHYDTFWQEGQLRPQVGVRLNMPIYRDRLNAAVREAEYRVSQRQAEYDQKLLDVQFEVQSTYARVEESRRATALYVERLVPLAIQNVAAAQANYRAAKGSFLDLATAQRQLIEISEREAETLANYHRRRAELERAVGGPLPGQSAVEQVPRPLPQ